MMEDFITRSLLMMLGYAYPAFQCFKTMEKSRAHNDELRFWCQYWIIMAILTILERVADAVVSWVPMYGELKLAFIIYLWYPKTKGSGYIYDRLLRPFVTDHETDFETKLTEWRAKAWDLAIFYWQNCTDLGQKSVFQFLEYMSSQSSKKTQSITKKNKRNPPPPPPNDTPTFYKPGKTRKNAYEAPRSNTVQVQLDDRTEYMHVIDDNMPEELGSHLGGKLHLPHLHLRRSEPHH